MTGPRAALVEGRRGRAGLMTAAVALLLIVTPQLPRAQAPSNPTVLIEEGRSLYLSGRGLAQASPDAPARRQPLPDLSAQVSGTGPITLRGPAAACANCHGAHAQGGGEGYTRAPSLRWPQWASDNPATRAEARDRLLAAAKAGLAADGRSLSVAMPRYQLAPDQMDALAAHLTALLSQAPAQAPLTLALLKRQDAPAVEAEVYARIEACLEPLGADIRLLRAEVANPGQARQQLRQWAAPPPGGAAVSAVLAPSMHGWDAGEAWPADSPPALFPLVADPVLTSWPTSGDDTSASTPAAERPAIAGAVHWLLGGPMARAAALVQYALAQQPNNEIPVWLGNPAQADARSLLQRRAQLQSITSWVERATGRRPVWVPLESTKQVPGVSGALWWDEETPPLMAGRWWVAQAWPARPARGAVWRMAQPDLSIRRPADGKPGHAMAELWGRLICTTVNQVLASGQRPAAAVWVPALAALGRLRDSTGAEWVLARSDAEGLGAVRDWALVEFAEGAAPRRLSSQIRVTGPQSH